VGAISLFFHRLYLAISRYSSNELSNHSGAVAYYFLLSIVPIILLILSIFDSLLSSYPGLSQEFFRLLEGFNPNLNEEFISKFQIGTGVAKAIGIFGILNLLWTSRLVFSSVQRAFDIIFPSPSKRNFLVNSFISVFVIPVLFLVVIVFTSLRIILSFLEELMLRIGISTELMAYIGGLSFFVPIVVSLIGAYFCYRYLPVRKPSVSAASQGAVLFTVLFFLLKIAYGFIINAAKLNMLYGVIGTVIVLMLWVYFICQAFFICAEFAYVCDKTEVLVIDKFFENIFGTKNNYIDKFIFGKHSRAFKNYSTYYPAGTVLFKNGEESEEIYYIYDGKVDIYLEYSKMPTASVSSGDMIGEMAHLLKSPRSATAIVAEDSVIVCISPQVFSDLIGINRGVALRIINTLSARLRAMNDRVT
jgi:membrane protein